MPGGNPQGSALIGPPQRSSRVLGGGCLKEMMGWETMVRLGQFPFGDGEPDPGLEDVWKGLLKLGST